MAVLGWVAIEVTIWTVAVPVIVTVHTLYLAWQAVDAVTARCTAQRSSGSMGPTNDHHQ